MTKYSKWIGDSIGCDWREEFCGKVEQIMGFLQGVIVSCYRLHARAPIKESLTLS